MAEKISFRRINHNTVTAALMDAMEHADTMQRVVILYDTKDGEDHSGGIFAQEDMTLSQMNFMLDRAKHWIFD